MEFDKFFCVKFGEELLKIKFFYSDNFIIKKREFNFIRKKDEKLEVTLSRIRTKMRAVSVSEQKKLQKSVDSIENEDTNLEIKLTHFGQVVGSNTINLDAWTNNTLVTVGGCEYEVIVDYPEVLELSLPKIILSGYLVCPKFSFDSANQGDSVFTWFRSLKKEEAKFYDKTLLHRSKNGEYWFKISDDFLYWTSHKDIGHRLKLICIPKCKDVCGKSEEVISSNLVIAGPQKCAFEDRLEYTRNLTSSGSIRCVTYNILADVYADRNFAKNELFSHCLPKFLDLEYRKQLYIKEITGYNADIICLQEVDRKVFQHLFIPVLNHYGLTGVYNEKSGNSIEGLACFVRSSKFRLLHSEGVSLGKILSSDSIFKDIWDRVSTNEKFKSRILKLTTVLQLVLLECLDVPKRQILVANTHLYYRPKSNNVRLIQAAVCIRYIEHKLAEFQQKSSDVEIALIFCGDFNSNPNNGVFKFLIKGDVSKDCLDWKSDPEEAVRGLPLKHSFNFGSGCGTPAYTNYIQGFNGCLDYIFYDRNYFTVTDVVPLPTDKQVKELIALPNQKFPSDHLALVCTLTW